MKELLTNCFIASATKDVCLKFQFWNSKGSSKKFRMSAHLWVGRQWEGILCYISKIDEKYYPWSKRAVNASSADSWKLGEDARKKVRGIFRARPPHRNGKCESNSERQRQEVRRGTSWENRLCAACDSDEKI